MKIVISKKSLLDVLSIVEKCVSKTEIMPITGSILVTANKDEISVVSTDTEKGMRVTEKCSVTEEGSAVIPFKKLNGIVKELSSQNDISISATDNKATIVSGCSRFNMSLFKVSEFPLIDFDCKDGDKIVMKERDVRKINQYISMSVSNDAVFTQLSGIYMISGNDKIHYQSTDQRRLSELSFDYKDKGFANGILIPSESITSISNIIEDSDNEVEIKTDYKRIFFKTGNKTMSSRLLEGKFPNFSGKIPNYGHKIIFKTTEFENAVRQIVPFVSKDVFSLNINVSGETAVLSIKDASGDAEVKINVEQKEGNEFSCCLRCDFIQAFLRASKSEKVTWEVLGAKNGVIGKVEGEDGYITMLMPLG